MSVSHNCPCTEACPLQHAMEMIGGKWKLPILCALAVDGATRYNDLKRKLGGISNTMLAKSLKELEDNGLVTRTEYMEVPIRCFSLSNWILNLLHKVHNAFIDFYISKRYYFRQSKIIPIIVGVSRANFRLPGYDQRHNERLQPDV